MHRSLFAAHFESHGGCCLTCTRQGRVTQTPSEPGRPENLAPPSWGAAFRRAPAGGATRGGADRRLTSAGRGFRGAGSRRAARRGRGRRARPGLHLRPPRSPPLAAWQSMAPTRLQLGLRAAYAGFSSVAGFSIFVVWTVVYRQPGTAAMGGLAGTSGRQGRRAGSVCSPGAGWVFCPAWPVDSEGSVRPRPAGARPAAPRVPGVLRPPLLSAGRPLHRQGTDPGFFGGASGGPGEPRAEWSSPCPAIAARVPARSPAAAPGRVPPGGCRQRVHLADWRLRLRVRARWSDACLGMSLKSAVGEGAPKRSR